MKKYRIGFDVWGLVLFLLIMLPNFVWFAYPAPNDILRAESATEIFDIIASICQVSIVVCLCFFINQDSEKLHTSPLIVATVLFCLLYFVSWVVYYVGQVGALVVLGLTLFPCFAFFTFALDRKNMLAVIPISIFTLCHLEYGVVNFIM